MQGTLSKWRRFEGQGVSFFIIETVQFKTDFSEPTDTSLL